MKILPEKRYLSASRIKTLKDCAWKYFVQYFLRLESSNSGSLKGTGVHTVFECLSRPKHRELYDLIVENQDIRACPVVDRYIKYYLKKVGLEDEADYEDCARMIVVGLNWDFFHEGCTELLPPEFHFKYENEGPIYRVNGFIDSAAKFERKKEIRVRDYKSSKKKFQPKELKENLQALMYSLVFRKLYPGYKIIVEFIFLKFPENPAMEISFDDETLDGFEYHLEEVNEKVDNFNEDDATKNFANRSRATSWMCEVWKKDETGKKYISWQCPYKESFDYYSLIDATGKILKSSRVKKDLVLESGTKIVKAKYDGCPAHNEKNTEDYYDPFI